MKKEKQENPYGDELAKAIAERIIKYQCRIANVINTRINRVSITAQKWLLIIFCMLSASGLILGLINPLAKLTLGSIADNYQPIHIGLPSDLPKQMKPKQKDSLTQKK